MAKPKDKEALIIEIMQEAEKDGEPVTREEAEEMAEAEINYNTNRHYERAKSTNTADRKKPTRKPDEQKLSIAEILTTALQNGGYAPNHSKEGEIEIAGFTIKIIRHRPK